MRLARAPVDSQPAQGIGKPWLQIRETGRPAAKTFLLGYFSRPTLS